jgi:YtkA-like
MRNRDLTRKFLVAGALFAAVLSVASPALAGAADYVFEPVKADIKNGDAVTLAVRLLHKPSGKPVSNAVIIQSRIDMTPDGMAEMTSPLTPLPSPEPGVYAFKSALTMQGRWLLSIAAKVQGEPETVIGKITFRATR